MPLHDPYAFERLDKDGAVLLIIDLQGDHYGLACDFDPTIFHNYMIAHAALGILFSLPVVVTTSAQTGPNEPTSKPIPDMCPDAPIVARNGEVNAWDNEEFRQAIRATGKSQIVLAGIFTEVSLSLRAEKYSVWANVEASGTTTILIRDVSNDRTARAGVQMVSLFAIISDLMRDWGNGPGVETVLPWLAQYYPAHGHIAAAHGYAIANGAVIPGQKDLVLRGQKGVDCG